MAETMGSLIDKICISELKLTHIQEQIDRPDATPEIQELCRNRFTVMTQQRDDLTSELSALVEAWKAGRYTPKIYRQFKMYNDPRFNKTAK